MIDFSKFGIPVQTTGNKHYDELVNEETGNLFIALELIKQASETREILQGVGLYLDKNQRDKMVHCIDVAIDYAYNLANDIYPQTFKDAE